MTSIKKATVNDVNVIREIAEAAWWPTYRNILSVDQIRYMLQTIYGQEIMLHQMETESQQYLLLLDGNQPVAFAAYLQEKKHLEAYKLEKLYCLPESQGKGFGKRLIEEVSQIAIRAGKKYLYLNVNRHNTAKVFYEKLDFQIVFETDIAIGPYWMNDYVMRKVL